MRIEFPYVREKSQLVGTILRPVARVILNNNYPHLLYVDSGADITLLPRSVGGLIGLRKEKGEKPSRISGVGKSSVFVLIRRVTMTIGTSRFPARVAWSLVEDVPCYSEDSTYSRGSAYSFKNTGKRSRSTHDPTPETCRREDVGD